MPAVDVVVYTLIALALDTAALIATCGTAPAATRVDPVTTLRID